MGCWVKQKPRSLTILNKKWQDDLMTSPMCSNYRMYNQEHILEEYFYNVPSFYVNALNKFTICNKYFPVETLRWQGIDREHRKCTLCPFREIGHAFHNLFRCSHFTDMRSKYLPSFNSRFANLIMYIRLMNENDKTKLTKAFKIISILIGHFIPTGCR